MGGLLGARATSGTGDSLSVSPQASGLPLRLWDRSAEQQRAPEAHVSALILVPSRMLVLGELALEAGGDLRACSSSVALQLWASVCVMQPHPPSRLQRTPGNSRQGASLTEASREQVFHSPLLSWPRLCFSCWTSGPASGWKGQLGEGWSVLGMAYTQPPTRHRAGCTRPSLRLLLSKP